jgi:hypothetical protein
VPNPDPDPDPDPVSDPVSDPDPDSDPVPVPVPPPFFPHAPHRTAATAINHALVRFRTPETYSAPDRGETGRMPAVRALLVVIAALVAMRATPAHADAAAEALFQEGRDLMAAGDIPGACDRFQRSNELEAKVGTLLNLGNCREQQGKLAEAWSAFSDARSLATVQGDGRAEEAAKRAHALEPKLAWLTITVAAEGRAAELAITRDGAPVLAAVWDRAVPVDPGTHEIAASAPGYKPWTKSLSIALGARDAVAVPALEVDPDATRPELPGVERAAVPNPPLRYFAVGAAFGGTSDTDIVGGVRVIGGYPVPHGAVRATLQYLYTRWHPDDDPYHLVQLHAIGLGLDYLLPWSKGLASAAGLGAGIDIYDDNYAGTSTDNFFQVRASPLIVRLGSPRLEIGLHAYYAVSQEILTAVVGVDWFVR